MLAAISALACLTPSVAPLDPSDYAVRPVYVYPADQPMHAEYAQAIQSLAVEIQDWYRNRAGVTFKLEPLQVLKGWDYLRMRGGDNPSEEVMNDIQKLPHWWDALQKIVKGPGPRSVIWVFAQGGGGFAGANLWGDYQGFATFGDWVLEPISGVREPNAIHAGYATWQVQGGTPKGTTAHELGHAFGLHHPDNYPGKSVMRWHGDYPHTGLLPHEVMILRNSPFFVADAFDPTAPWLDFEIEDACVQGETLVLRGKRFEKGMRIEFRWVNPAEFDKGALASQQSVFVDPKIEGDTRASVRVPEGYGPGFIRAWQGRRKGNAVPINGYPKG